MKKVAAWLAEGRPVFIGRVVETHGISSSDRAASVAYTPGQPLDGELFGGAANEQLPTLLTQSMGFVDLRITDATAATAGLACGGVARLYVQPADTIPAEVWAALAAERPVALVTDTVTGVTTLGTSKTGVSATGVQDDLLITAYWPTPRVSVIGTGSIADAIAAIAALLGWQYINELPTSLGPADNVVVLEHDLDISGAALSTALAAKVGYIGALGSRHTQGRRADWLAARGVTDIGAIHGPAGLDIGSRTPVEIALSIVAQIVSVRR